MNKYKLHYIILLLLSFFLVIMSLSLGSNNINIFYIYNNSNTLPNLILDERISRTLAAIVCGSSLGVSGSLIQSVTKNPLGDPSLFGINTGAIFSVFLFGSILKIQVPYDFFLALPGAIIVTFFISIISFKNTNQSIIQLILLGAAINALVFAIITLFIYISPYEFLEMQYWLIGSLSNIPIETIFSIFPIFIVSNLILLFMFKQLNIVFLSKDIAKSLGVNVSVIVACTLLISSILTSVSVSLAGSLSFIGLGTAHIVRIFVGNKAQYFLPTSMIVGAILMLLADIISRILVPSQEIMTGIICSLVGSIILITFLLKKINYIK